MTLTLAISVEIETKLRGLVDQPVEGAAVLLAHEVRGPSGNNRLVVTDLVPVPDHAYVRRATDELLITSDGYVPALGVAAERGAIPLWFHTHAGNGAQPRPSPHDDRVDLQLQEPFILRSGSDLYGSVIASIDNGRLQFSGRLFTENSVVAMDRVLSIGSRISLYQCRSAGDRHVADMFSRNVRAFGGDIQSALGDLGIAIVGCGGTGSAVAEQLVRLGVRRLLLIDPDQLSASNITRVYGSTPDSIGLPKVDVLAEHLRAIAPDLKVMPVASTVVNEQTARLLGDVDVVFGCTDDNAGRMVLSRAATYLMVPVIDMGVVIDGSDRLDGVFARVTVLHPGAACLICRGRIDIARAASEALEPAERERRIREGYAAALPGVEPAVVAYTTAVAAAAVNELLERLVWYGPAPVPNELILRIHDREMSTNIQAPSPGHYCDPVSKKIGRGDTEPYLEQLWAA